MSKKLSIVFIAFAWTSSGAFSQLAAQEAEQGSPEAAEIARDLGEYARSSAAHFKAAPTGRIG